MGMNGKGNKKRKRNRKRKKLRLYGTLFGSLILFLGCLFLYGILDQRTPKESRAEAVREPEVQEIQTQEQTVKVQEEFSKGQETPQKTAEPQKQDAQDLTQPGQESEPGPQDTAALPSPEDDGGSSRTAISIMGDSISTFDGWLPEGFYDFYPLNGEIKDVEQTWWKMLLQETGLRLCVNASSSGSTCVGNSTSTDDPQSGCSDYRIEALAGEDGTDPDIIIVYMGTNDVIQNIPLGENDGSRPAAEGTIENFSDAYCLILDKLKTKYPQAQIYCCNLLPIGEWGTKQPFETFVNGEGLTSEDYSGRIETIARTKGCPVIDLKNCGLTIDNMQQYVSDGVHLNPEGMKLIKDTIKAAIAGIL